MFTPQLEENGIQIHLRIFFQMGWFNRQLEETDVGCVGWICGGKATEFIENLRECHPHTLKQPAKQVGFRIHEK